MWVKGFGEDQDGEVYVFGSIDLGPSGTSGVMLKMVPPGAAPRSRNSYVQMNLVSDLPRMAPVTDTNLVNPWGLAFGPNTLFWVADNHSGLSTVYESTGGVQSLVVRIPTAGGGTPPGAPTGIVFNDTTGFDVGGSPARFIFATEDGTISAWNAGTNAVLKMDNSASDAVYKGLALATNGGKAFLYATDFRGGKMDVFDSNFQLVNTEGLFHDPGIPAGFAPFNVRNFGGILYVTYARQNEDKEDDVAGDGNGFITLFDVTGKMVKRFASNGTLNSPWGLAMAPASFGAFSGALLVGNFGDGRINAFDPATGSLLGQLRNPNGILIWVEGLWDIAFGNGAKAGETNKLYFTAGIAGGGGIEDHGLFGSVSVAFPAPILISVTRTGNSLHLTVDGGTGPFTLQKKLKLSDPAWINVKSFTETSTVVTLDADAAFFRIQGTSQ